MSAVPMNASALDDVLAARGGAGIVFQNPGEIDIMAITTFGLSAKVGDSPIGMFGTGLKYAIAVLLRHGCTITIWRGLSKLEFDFAEHESRGKTFQIVRMNGTPLSFMTDLGPKWELWMAFRELFCNAKDEAGECFWSDDFEPQEGVTAIVVTGAAFEEVYRTRHKYVLDSKPLFECDGVEVHDGEASTIFYRGIAVKQFEGGITSLYTYNIKEELFLTEDRTVRFDHQPGQLVAKALQKTDHAEYVERCLTANSKSFEGRFDFGDSWMKQPPSETFLNVARTTVASRAPGVKVNPSAIDHAVAHTPIAARWEEIELQPQQRVMWVRLEALLTGLGYDLEKFAFSFWDHLGVGVYAAEGNRRGEIRVSSDAFEAGSRKLGECVLTEIIRVLRRDDDEEDFVAREIMRIGERLVFGHTYEAAPEPTPKPEAPPPAPAAEPAEDEIPF